MAARGEGVEAGQNGGEWELRVSSHGMTNQGDKGYSIGNTVNAHVIVLCGDNKYTAVSTL